MDLVFSEMTAVACANARLRLKTQLWIVKSPAIGAGMAHLGGCAVLRLAIGFGNETEVRDATADYSGRSLSPQKLRERSSAGDWGTPYDNP
jgi:hypothetical protein